jgi:hypothetical protein
MADIDSTDATPPPGKAVPEGYRDPITVWLLLVGALVIVMILVGGFVRLSRAGLSIVEWDVVTGGSSIWNGHTDCLRVSRDSS